MHGAGRLGAAPVLTRRGACADFIEITQPTTPPSCSTCSRASSFFPPTTTLFSCVWSCISQDFLSPPMAAGLPSFVRIGQRLLSMLRLGMARVAHLVLQDLGLANRGFPAGSPLFLSRSLHAPGFQLSLPVWTDHPSFTAIGRCLLTLLRLGVAKSPFSTWLVLHDLAAGLQRPRRPGISILNFRRQLFRVSRDLADS